MAGQNLLDEARMAEKSGAGSRFQAAFHEALGRMETVVDQETSLLRENRAVELTEFNLRKQQGLRECPKFCVWAWLTITP